MNGRAKKGPITRALELYYAGNPEYLSLPTQLQDLVGAVVQKAKKDGLFFKEITLRVDGHVPKEQERYLPDINVRHQTLTMIEAGEGPAAHLPPVVDATPLPGQPGSVSRAEVLEVPNTGNGHKIEEPEVERLPIRPLTLDDDTREDDDDADDDD